ncbi:MAG: MotA/TolQ/ExbB proton channel family protein [Phycisphaeraceae bacterium]|nr:MotA/TolQ/ExbB proton channel family protein [Phycisphaeraceae bacterium]
MPRQFIAALTLLLVLLPAGVTWAEDDTVVTESLFQRFFISADILGTIIIWTLLLLSAVTVAFIIKLLLDYRQATLIPPETVEQLEMMLQEKRYREAIEAAGNDSSYLGKLVSAGLNEASNGYPAMERAIQEVADAETTKMLRPVEVLNVIGNISPMMGLFGTVYGMILAFQKLVELGGQPDPAELAGGISTALVTTFWGLVVAMPALLFYAVIRNKLDATTTEGMMTAEGLIRPFKPSGGGRKPGAVAKGGKASPQPSGGGGAPPLPGE